MRGLALLVVTALATVPGSSAAAAQPAASAPATRKIVSPADMEPLHDGSIRYFPPPAPQWKLVGKTDDNRKVVYQTADGLGRVDVTVSPQNRDVPDEFSKQMAMIIGKGIREDADRKGRTILLQPRVE